MTDSQLAFLFAGLITYHTYQHDISEYEVQSQRSIDTLQKSKRDMNISSSAIERRWQNSNFYSEREETKMQEIKSISSDRQQPTY